MTRFPLPVDRGPTHKERAALLERFALEKDADHNMAPHMAPLFRYAEASRSCAEIGVQRGRSAVALLLGCSGFVIGVDVIRLPTWIPWLEHFAGDRFAFWHAESEAVDLPEVDLLFIDGEHTYRAVTVELARHAPKVRRWILLHDTIACRNRGAVQHGTEEPRWLEDDPGIWPAVESFLLDSWDWRLKEEIATGCGLAVLERKGQCGTR